MDGLDSTKDKAGSAPCIVEFHQEQLLSWSSLNHSQLPIDHIQHFPVGF